MNIRPSRAQLPVMQLRGWLASRGNWLDSDALSRRLLMGRSIYPSSVSWPDDLEVMPPLYHQPFGDCTPGLEVYT